MYLVFLCLADGGTAFWMLRCLAFYVFFFKIYFLILGSVYTCVFMQDSLHVSAGTHRGQKRVSHPSRAGVTSDCKPLKVGVGMNLGPLNEHS